MKRDPRHRGFALLMVLWALGFLALLGTSLVAVGRQDTQRARNLIDGATAEAAADGAVQQAIFGLLDTSDQHWNPDSSVHVLRFGQYLIEVRLDDEAGKVNPNIASEELLQSLLLQLGVSPPAALSLAAAIADWRAAGQQPRPTGAKAPQYAAAGRDYGPPGAPFESLDELGAVLGMTPPLLAVLRPHLTLYTDDDPDASTTDPIVAAALGERVRAATNRGTINTPQVVTVSVIVHGPRRTGFSERVVVRTNALDNTRRYELLAREAVVIPSLLAGP
ncbi:MAG: general secretion pathway protein GspK [Acetobacteraceae bacterium]|nr:general secretion pathway protein GspK [Acetobacteraceae bacterium]